MGAIRILLADDHTIMREGVRALLQTASDLEVVGEASDGLEAIEKALELRPDVIVLDLAMPRLGGFEAAEELQRKLPRAKLLVLSQHEQPEYVHRMLRAGASGYVLKKAAGHELINAIRRVFNGGSYLDPAVAGEVVDRYIRKTTPDPEPDAEGPEQLTPREHQVLKLIADGLTNKEAAAALGISVKTVMAHRANLMAKIGSKNRSDLVKYAIRHGITDAG